MKKSKKNKSRIFVFVIVLSYVLTFIFRSKIGLQAIDNSFYYLKEMLMIMPVIFVLTALLDFWVPKKVIMKYLGEEAKVKGIVFSFILGGISAGPIYAAFTICVMLLKKGASIRNVVIILSSWAVIKVPMLLNEMKFLGTRFMVIRWILTVIAIIIFSYIASKIVKTEDIVFEEVKKVKGLSINKEACIGCSLCSKIDPEVFEMKNRKASVIHHDGYNKEKVKSAISRCPSNAIEYFNPN